MKGLSSRRTKVLQSPSKRRITGQSQVAKGCDSEQVAFETELRQDAFTRSSFTEGLRLQLTPDPLLPPCTSHELPHWGTGLLSSNVLANPTPP